MCNRPFVYANHLNCNASFARKILYVFISARQRSCGKVMFLQLFVCPQGEDIMSLPVWSHVLSGGFCLQRGRGSTSRWRYWPSGIRGLLSHSGIFARRPVAEGHPPSLADTALGSMYPTGMHSCFHCIHIWDAADAFTGAQYRDVLFCFSVVDINNL